MLKEKHYGRLIWEYYFAPPVPRFNRATAMFSSFGLGQENHSSFKI
jgi:hypothetical protein